MLRHLPLMTFLVLTNVGCDQNHRYQRSFRAFEREQLPPDNTMAIKEEIRVPSKNLSSLKEGRILFEKNCIPCHGITGDGHGIVTLKGLTPPPSYHDDRLREESEEYFVEIMTNGKGRMPSYRRRLEIEDRYKIAYYIKALQISRKVHERVLLPQDRRSLP